MKKHPEEMVIETLKKHGITCSTNVGFDKAEEYVIVIRNGMDASPVDWSESIILKTYDILLAVYAPTKFRAATLSEEIFDFLSSIELDYPDLQQGAVGSISSIADFNKKSAYALNLILAFEYQPQNI